MFFSGRVGQTGMYRTSPHFSPFPSWLGSPAADKMTPSHGYNPHAYAAHASSSWHSSLMKHYQNPQNQSSSYSGYGYPPTPPDDSHGGVHLHHQQHQQSNNGVSQQQQQEHPMSTSPALPQPQQQQPLQPPSNSSSTQPQTHLNSQHTDNGGGSERMSPDRVAGTDTPLETETSCATDVKPSLDNSSAYHSVFGANFSVGAKPPSLSSLSPNQGAGSTVAATGYSGYPSAHSSMDFSSSSYPSFYPSTTMSSVFSKPFGGVSNSAASPSQDKKNSKRSTTGNHNLSILK